MVETYRDKAWVLVKCTEYNDKKLLEIKLGFGTIYGNVMVKKLLELKLRFGDMNACCKPRFEI